MRRLKKRISTKIVVRAADATEARELFLAAGFTAISETERSDALISFNFDVAEDLQYALCSAIPECLYAHRAVVSGGEDQSVFPHLLGGTA